MECLARNGLDGDEVNLNNHNITSLSSELSFSPFSEKLFFQHIPVLQVLDLSRTSIQSFPPSISRLYLLEKLILQECSLLMEVPPEVGALKNLKLFDLEGTELMYLPEQIGELETLEHLRVSLSACADDQKDRYGIQYIIPRMMISKLSKLKELSISVDPEAEWWEVELLEAIMGDLPFLPEIKTLKLYLPTAKALQQFLRLERFRVPIYSSLWNYRFIIGRCEQLPFSVQLDIEESFLKLEKCVKYMNGEGYNNETLELIRDAKALYLRRHWTAEKLTVFDIRRLKYCLLMECNELQTLVDQGDLYEHKNRSTGHSEDEILGSLQYLSIHFMKKIQRISKGRIGRNSLSCLRILALHTCPMLTSIFTGCLLGNMQSLTELIVEDCPKVKCLVDLGEVTPRSNGPFLLSLRRVSLIDLPELVSISGGISIAPQLDTLLIFNCMKLNYLSDMEIPRDTKAIKGEIEWWDALKDGKLTWHNVFVQLKRDGGLMDQLAEDTNSLKHFLDLEMIPSNHGSDQNSLMDHHLGCNYMSTKEDLEHVDQLHIDSVLFSNEIQKTEDTDCDMKAVNHQLSSSEKKSNNSDIDKLIQLKREPQIGDQVPPDGGYIWRKHLENGTRNSRQPSIEDQEPIVPEHQDCGWPTSRIVRVSRASGGKDRHSMVLTSKGLRDRRVRLSVSTAIQFYDLQDRLGYDQPSKAVEWLLKAASTSIDELPSLDPPFSTVTNCIDDLEDPSHHHHHHQNKLVRRGNNNNVVTKSPPACSSTSETSKGSGLSLSNRSENRIKARERAREMAVSKKDKDKETDQLPKACAALYPTSSFTDLLTGGIASRPVCSETRTHWTTPHLLTGEIASRPVCSETRTHWTTPPLLMGGIASRPVCSETRTHWTTPPMDYFFARNPNPPSAQLIQFNNHHQQQHFAFLQDSFVPTAISGGGGGGGGGDNLNVSMSTTPLISSNNGTEDGE